MGKSLQHLFDFTFIQMANLTLVRRDSYLEQLKQGVKPDTFSSLRNCPLNGYPPSLTPSSERLRTKLPNMNLLSVPPSPVWAMGGSPVGTKKVKLDINPTPPDGKVRIHLNPRATLAKICQAGRALEGVADPAVGAGEVHLIAVPEAPRTLISTNDNYCVKDPVLTTRSLNVVLTETQNSNVNCSLASLVHFATNSVRQPQKKGLSPPLKHKSEIKFVNCVSFVGPCVSAPTVPNAHSVVMLH